MLLWSWNLRTLSVGLKEVLVSELSTLKSLQKRLFQNTSDVSAIVISPFVINHFYQLTYKLHADTKMTSFQRQLNLYGFRRVTKGEDTGSYYHAKFQRGRRDLISEIKRLPGKAPPSDHKVGPARDSNHGKSVYNPTNRGVVEVYDPGQHKSMSVSKLTANVNGLQPLSAAPNVTKMHPPATLQSQPPPPRIMAHSSLPAYMASGAVQFLPVSTPLPVPGVALTREVCDQPLLLRNFSVSSTFDEEYRLSSGEDGMVFSSGNVSGGVSGEGDGVDPPSSVTAGETCSEPDRDSRSISGDVSLNDASVRPAPPVREESESWVKLGALDAMQDMEPFDIETVFE